MPIYETTVTATSNSVAGTEDQFVEIVMAASSAGRIRRVSVSAQTPSQDCTTTVKLRRNSAAGATGTGGTATKQDAQMRNTSATANVKNGVNNFTVGTNVDIPHIENFNGRTTWQWIPRNMQEEIITVGGNRFAVGIQCSSASVVHTVSVVWED